MTLIIFSLEDPIGHNCNQISLSSTINPLVDTRHQWVKISQQLLLLNRERWFYSNNCFSMIQKIQKVGKFITKRYR